jgi:hypothetical protein
MPADFDRYISTPRFVDDGETDITYLGNREPIQFVDDPDNEIHIVQAGDNLQNLAARYFKGFPEAANLWWVLAEFQPDAVQDPTLRLQPGTLLVIPNANVVQTLVTLRSLEQAT